MKRQIALLLAAVDTGLGFPVSAVGGVVLLHQRRQDRLIHAVQLHPDVDGHTRIPVSGAEGFIILLSIVIPHHNPPLFCPFSGGFRPAAGGKLSPAGQIAHLAFECCEPAGHTYQGGEMVGYDVTANQPYFDAMGLERPLVFYAPEYSLDHKWEEALGVSKLRGLLVPWQGKRRTGGRNRFAPGRGT